MDKVRFAPSPTGGLHPGNARVAVFNWLYARKNNAIFVLRIEDTDLERSSLEHESSILGDLNWLGIDWDEGPFRQSEREYRYSEISNKLLETGWAYKCWCSEEELEAERDAQIKAHKAPRYSGKCKDVQTGTGSFAIRFNVDRFINEFGAKVSFLDLIRKDKGELVQSARDIGDFVLNKRTGTATYNLAVVIDDMDMNITHVFRGEDHISNTFKQIMLFKAINRTINIPAYGHLPMLLAPDRTKLSKRSGGVPIGEYRAQGFLPEAVFNHLAFLGGLYGNMPENITKEELIQHFDYEKTASSASIYDVKKLSSVNSMFIAKKDNEELLELLGKDSLLIKNLLSIYNKETVKKIISVAKEGTRSLNDIRNGLNIFVDTKASVSDISTFNEEQKKLYEHVNEFVSKNVESVVGENWVSFKTDIVKSTTLTGSKLWKTLRLIFTGLEHGAPLDDIMTNISPDILRERISKNV